ncbi:hypothetical protein [Polynucleobacter sp.]|uniref:hypothetical protein n=1 Tax=Polynucleobacter sp. TaxID=2029855 RepID=UPI003F697F32
MNKESIDLYCTNKTSKLFEAIEENEELDDMKENINLLISQINKKILSIADSIYPGISKGQYARRYLGNVKHIEDLFHYDARREVYSHIEIDVTEKLIDEALAKTKILEE